MNAVQTKTSLRLLYTSPAILAATPFLSACASMQKTQASKTDHEAMASLMMPCRIEIIEPFTRVRDFNQDGSLDGIELLMQAVNAQGNPGLQIVGNLIVELYEFTEASAQPKGKRIDHWMVDLGSVELQQKHWNQLTQMYEFRLEVDPDVVPRKKKFVLAVTYNTPENTHYMDQCVLEYDIRGYSSSATGPSTHDAG